MMQQRPVKIPRGLSAYVASQRREEHFRAQPAAGSVTARRRDLQPQDGVTGTEPDYGCVEWFDYEHRRA